jgi:hypothetical protein
VVTAQSVPNVNRHPYSVQVGWRQFTPLKQRYTGTYWGPNQWDAWPTELDHLVRAAPRYIDFTAGGGQRPVEYAREGKTVTVNDRNPYAFLNLQSVLKQEWMMSLDRNDWFEDYIAAPLHPENILGHDRTGGVTDGYLLNARVKEGKHPKVSKELARYIDTILTLAAPSLAGPDAVVKSALMRTLMNQFTYRGMVWAGTDVNKRQLCDVPVDEFYQIICRAAWRIRLFAESVSRQPHEVIGLDALQAISIATMERGTFCYVDPAWPWSKASQGGANPYRFHTSDLSAILMQRELPEFDAVFWETGKWQKVFDDLVSWVSTAFERGAGYFCVDTQDTNDPPFEKVYEYLCNFFKPYGKGLYLTESRSSGANKRYGEIYMMFVNE